MTLEELNKFNSDNYLIITFDYESHTLLLKNNIQHMLSDNYVTKSDIASLQEKLYRFSQFSKEPQFINFLIFDGVNLGSLFFIEFYVFLIPFLKKFLEIQKIHEKYHDQQFLASPDLVNLIKLFTTNVFPLGQNLSKSVFIYDSIKLNFHVKNFSFDINVSQRYYDALKNLLDKFIKYVNPSCHTALTKLPLLIEFDTIKYRRFLLEKNSKFLIYNRRRPTIWNFKSYNIMRHSQSIVITNNTLKTTQLNTINDRISQTELIIERLLTAEHSLSEFFSMAGTSFWNALKPHFIELCRKRIFDAIKEIKFAEQIFKNYSIAHILVWSETGFNEQIMIQLGKKYGVPIALLQHGLYYDTPEAKTSNEFQGVLPILSDKFIVWGESLRNYAIECGIPTEKIHVLGNPFFDELFENKNIFLQNEYILLTTQSPTDAAVNDLTVELIEKYENTIKKICEVVTKLNKKLVIKLHPDPFEFDITNLVREINPSIKVIKKGNIHSLLQKCELLVAIDISTSIVEAQVLGKPTISISVKNYSLNEDNCSFFKSQSCIRTGIDNFEIMLNNVLYDQDFKNQLIQNGNKFVNEYLSNQGIASVKLAQISFN